jgi:hypothetical protein
VLTCGGCCGVEGRAEGGREGEEGEFGGGGELGGGSHEVRHGGLWVERVEVEGGSRYGYLW